MKNLMIEIMNFQPIYLLWVSFLLFLIGIWGILLNRKNLILILISLEIILLAVNINFLVFSVTIDDLVGELFSIYILTVAAAESAIGLAILVAFYKLRNNINIETMTNLKG